MSTARHIPDESTLWRRVTVVPDWVVRDDDGNPIPTSAAFKDAELSTILEDDRNAQEYINTRFPTCGLATLSARRARELEQEVKFTPILEGPRYEPQHCDVIGNKKKKIILSPGHNVTVAKIMAMEATWIVPPSDELLGQQGI